MVGGENGNLNENENVRRKAGRQEGRLFSLAVSQHILPK